MENNLIEKIIAEKESPKTYLEILKVHNKEVPMANLLAFFFRADEKHGLKNLFIKALLKTKYYPLAGLKSENSNINSFINDNIEISNVKVKTEVNTEKVTKNKTRIDILIDTDKFVICIEFKINHDLDNPLTDYQEYVETKFPDKKYYFLILTPNKKKPIEKAKKYLDENKNSSKNTFKQVLLSHFIKKINECSDKKNINNFIFNDFIQTIENRSLKAKQEEILINIIKNAELTVYTAPLITTEKSEFWNELLTNLKVKKLSEEQSLFKELKIITISHHKNYRSGFIQITQDKYNVKIRIEDNKWQIEKWSKTNEIIENTTRSFEYNSDINIIKKEISNSIK